MVATQFIRSSHYVPAASRKVKKVIILQHTNHLTFPVKIAVHVCEKEDPRATILRQNFTAQFVCISGRGVSVPYADLTFEGLSLLNHVYFPLKKADHITALREAWHPAKKAGITLRSFHFDSDGSFTTMPMSSNSTIRFTTSPGGTSTHLHLLLVLHRVWEPMDAALILYAIPHGCPPLTGMFETKLKYEFCRAMPWPTPQVENGVSVARDHPIRNLKEQEMDESVRGSLSVVVWWEGGKTECHACDFSTRSRTGSRPRFGNRKCTLVQDSGGSVVDSVIIYEISTSKIRRFLGKAGNGCDDTRKSVFNCSDTMMSCRKLAMFENILVCILRKLIRPDFTKYSEITPIWLGNRRNGLDNK
ncbi:hypothetical protein DFH07DRAFT_771605 [Mycena maculata]|uniref:Uncharacterized protein n=1 Tax=Mycena maculata TaxID=230809 RepID=A0AAD7I883_9AGAR|nr:hypothetical protein DFH07DRAFT_779434 [Mycena maculata]KAJ7761281.1 hypothetical protein DFH07DRAFT_771605 [Mycena maculata]